MPARESSMALSLFLARKLTGEPGLAQPGDGGEHHGSKFVRGGPPVLVVQLADFRSRGRRTSPAKACVIIDQIYSVVCRDRHVACGSTSITSCESH
jgi:hypothetical protein